MIVKRLLTALCVSLTLLSASAASARAGVATARVRVVDGVPRLLVNGKPIRPRMFWGGPAWYSMRIPAGTHAYSVTFMPTMDEPARATLHFRFLHQTSRIVIHSVHMVDTTDGRDVIPPTDMSIRAAVESGWQFWPANDQDATGAVTVRPSDASGVGGIQIDMHAPPAGSAWADTHVYHKADLAVVRGHVYRLDVTLTSDVATMGSFNIYRPGDPYVLLATADTGAFPDQIKLAAAAGVDIVSFSVALPWTKTAEPPDFTPADQICDTILRANSKAILLPRIYMRAPDWWLDAHPGDEMRWDSQTGHQRTAAVSSLAFRADAGRQLTALIQHLESRFGPHMLGYHIAGQNTDEWFYQDSWGPDWNGYARSDTIAWRAWLARQYRTDGALRAAFNNPSATITTQEPPTPAERSSGDTELRDPAVQRAVLAWNRFQQDDMADEVLYFAHIVRADTNGRKLSVFFYGYLFEFGNMGNGVANSGHYALRRILSSPDIDCLVSPLSYDDRGLAGSGPLMSAVDSDALAGKLYIGEDDTATNLSQGNAPGSEVRASSVDDTNKILLRNIAQEALRNIGTWWMDLGQSGWFDDPAYWNLLRRFAPIDRDMLLHARPFHPEIAAVIDERGAPWLGRYNRVGLLISRSREALGRVGAPYGQYLQDDVAAGRVHAKLYVFLTAWSLTKGERANLLRRTAGATRIWCYAPGYFDGYTPSTAAMRDLTGFSYKIVAPTSGWATPTAKGIEMGLLPGRFGTAAQPRPTFAVTDAKPSEILATYEDGSTAAAIRKTADGGSIFCGVAALTPELARLAARTAGVHLYATGNATVFANGPFLAVHATESGPVGIDTGRAGPVVDAITGRTVARGPRFDLQLLSGDTRVFRY